MNNKIRRFAVLIMIITASELIFSLPFHIARFFRASFLQVFDITNTQLGDIFAVYGIVALLAYFPGGAIADRFSSRHLMTVSLLFTALGGVYLYSIPSITGLYGVFGYFGLTTILLFWAAMIKATRDWGGNNTQGIAFGLLDGGRGFVASLAASIALFILSASMVQLDDSAQTSKAALQQVIAFYSFATFLAALGCWFMLPDNSKNTKNNLNRENSNLSDNSFWEPTAQLFKVIKKPEICWLGILVLTAYCGYKALDNYALYAHSVLGMSPFESAQLTTYGSYIRPIAAISAGFIADRWRNNFWTTTLFMLAAISFFMLAFTQPSATNRIWILANLLVTTFAVFSIRAVYFSLIAKVQSDRAYTGAAAGLVSLVGFTPDIFFASISGRILDANPGLIGFQNYFLLISFICLLGLLASLMIIYSLGKSIQTKVLSAN